MLDYDFAWPGNDPAPYVLINARIFFNGSFIEGPVKPVYIFIPGKSCEMIV